MSLLAGCSLILDFDAPLIDGGPSGNDGGVTDGAAADTTTDNLEPNDDFLSASVIAAGAVGPLTIYPTTDKDFFKFNLAAPANVQIDCNFPYQSGDLDMLLFDGTQAQVDQSMHFDQDEHLTETALPAGDYYIEVLGFGGNFTNTYTLVLTVM